MARIGHGQKLSTADIEEIQEKVKVLNESIAAPFEVVTGPILHEFDYLFLDLQSKPAALLPESAQTVKDLIALGDTMHDPFVPGGAGDSKIPAAYTYLGQFIDHDITLEVDSGVLGDITSPALAPAPLAKARALKNLRTATLDLDSVYGPPAPRAGDKMAVNTVSASGGRPPGKDQFNDVPRKPPSNNPADKDIDREALIGDARNDENLIIAQLQVAFLRAHNAIVDRGKSFDEARRLLRQHYQWIVLHDFLPRVCDPKIVRKTIAKNRFYTPKDAYFFMPLEFTVAAYRFGHSMIRGRYDHNLNFTSATLQLLFTFTALSGQLSPGPNPTPGAGFPTLPENWIIQWERFVGAAPTNLARAIDPKLVEPIFTLPDTFGVPMTGINARLAVRNLLRGYLLRMPTGQAVAKKIGASPLSASTILKFAASDDQRKVLKSSGFHRRTPLWFYILAEAAATKKGRLGEVGSTLVAEVLVGLARRSEDTFLDVKGWKPTLGTLKGVFRLEDLLRLSGNL
jgi:hypothetical protein